MHITQALSMYCEDHLLDILIKDLPTTQKPLPKNHIDSLKTAYDSKQRNIAVSQQAIFGYYLPKVVPISQLSE